MEHVPFLNYVSINCFNASPTILLISRIPRIRKSYSITMQNHRNMLECFIRKDICPILKLSSLI